MAIATKQTACADCGQEGHPAIYHPYPFCILVKAGFDPEKVVRAAVPFLKPTKGWKHV